MAPPPRPFRLVYRAFDRIEFDPGKSDEVLEARGFDLGYVSRIFPGYVLEREDTRGYPLLRRASVSGNRGVVGRGIRGHLHPTGSGLPDHHSLDR